MAFCQKNHEKNDDHNHEWPLLVVSELANDDHHVQTLGDFFIKFDRGRSRCIITPYLGPVTKFVIKYYRSFLMFMKLNIICLFGISSSTLNLTAFLFLLK